MSDMSNEELATWLLWMANDTGSRPVWTDEVMRNFKEAAERLREPKWIPFDDFMKDSVGGVCWVIYYGEVEKGYCRGGGIIYDGTESCSSQFLNSYITHVQPITNQRRRDEEIKRLQRKVFWAL